MHGSLKEISSEACPIEVIDDALPEPLVAAVEEEIYRQGFEYGWRSTKDKGYSHWNRIFAGSELLNREEVVDDLCPPVRALWDHLAKSYAAGSTVIRAYANAYTYGTEGYIHHDSKIASDVTLLLYLSPDWRREWAGETIFFEGDNIVRAVLPKYNRLIVFPSRMDHVGRSVSRICPVERIIFTFKVKTE